MNTEQLLRTLDPSTAPTDAQQRRADALLQRIVIEPVETARRPRFRRSGIVVTIAACVVLGGGAAAVASTIVAGQIENEAYNKCMTDAGWPLHVIQDQEHGPGLAEANQRRFDIDTTACVADTRTLTAYGPVADDGKPRSAFEANRMVADCLIMRGFDVTVGRDWIRYSGTDDADSARYNAATEECGQGLTPDPASFTDAQWTEIYQQSLTTRECLRERGYTFTEPPTLEQFKSSQGAWEPYTELVQAGQLPALQVAELQLTCPGPSFWPVQ